MSRNERQRLNGGLRDGCIERRGEAAQERRDNEEAEASIDNEHDTWRLVMADERDTGQTQTENTRDEAETERERSMTTASTQRQTKQQQQAEETGWVEGG